MLDDKDFAAELKLFLLKKSKEDCIFAKDIVDIIATSEMQEKITKGGKPVTISLRTAQRWLRKLDWHYGKKQPGMYIDDHEREDVVAYRNEFVKRWKDYERRMVVYDNDGSPTFPCGFPVTQGPRPTPEQKGEGPSIMVSSFLMPDWGLLTDEEDEAQLFFKAGKTQDGYFSGDDLLAKVEKAIDIFENKTHGMMTGLFMFDNAPSHQKRSQDALSARKMPKKPSESWTHHPNGPKMRDAQFNDGTAQSLHFSDDHPTMPGWFKGTQQIFPTLPVRNLNFKNT
ncbi:hypothetical protein GGU10DRAFT_397818 [Lentinula aff. detonsa]|uniref:Uncharacterized protein n=1 Tax=Lentinula aff. detonsa TaxID=2804958 RepID=A0AA38NHE6_9AGAR|nr:hypothetical protein GGU10DRAFT_397818 [Lentinula aff. detonsa]